MANVAQQIQTIVAAEALSFPPGALAAAWASDDDALPHGWTAWDVIRDVAERGRSPEDLWDVSITLRVRGVEYRVVAS